MKQKIIFVVCLLFGLMFINSGLNKFFNYIPIPKDLPESLVKFNKAMVDFVWLLPLIATVEIIGGALFIVKRYRALGAIIVFPIMVGILLTHLFQAPTGLPIAIALLLINIWAIIENRNKYMAMIADK